MAAAGKVITGFSKPYVAKYTNNAGTVTYSDGQILARGVEVDLEVETSDSNNFYCDNLVGETVAGQFTSGTVTLTVDGLLQAAEKLIMGLPDADSDGFIAYNSNQSIPFVGVGFIVRYLQDGVTTYEAIVLPKVAFKPFEVAAATQEDEVDFQTTEIEGDILRDDTSDQNWRLRGGEQTTEALALADIKKKLA